MPDEAQVHVIAVVDFDNRQGEIKFVLPVSGDAIAPSPSDVGYRDDRVKLALIDRNRAPLWQASPPLGIIA